jgi:hypothetical protein
MPHMLAWNARNQNAPPLPIRSDKFSNTTETSRQRLFSRPAPQIPLEPRDRRRVDDFVEQHRAPDQQRETCNLQPFETLPAQAQRDEPDEKCAAGVDCAARCGGDLARDGEAEEVETAGEKEG